MARPRRSSTAGPGPGPAPAQLDTLPVLLKLVLAQAVYETGTSDWKTVAATLKAQPFLAQVKPVLNATVSVACVRKAHPALAS